MPHVVASGPQFENRWPKCQWDQFSCWDDWHQHAGQGHIQSKALHDICSGAPANTAPVTKQSLDTPCTLSLSFREGTKSSAPLREKGRGNHWTQTHPTAATELGFTLNNSKWAFLQLFFSLEIFLNKYLSLLFSYMDFLLFFPNEEWIYSVLIVIVRNLFCPRSTQESSRVNCWEDNSTSQSGLGVCTRKTSSQQETIEQNKLYWGDAWFSEYFHLPVCVPVSVYVCVHLWWMWLWRLSCTLHSSVTWDSGWTCSSYIQVGWLANELYGSPVSTPQCWGYSCIPHPAFFVSFFTMYKWFCLHVCLCTTYKHAWCP